MENLEGSKSKIRTHNEVIKLLKQYVAIKDREYHKNVNRTDIFVRHGCRERLKNAKHNLKSGNIAEYIVHEDCVRQRVVEVSTRGEGSRMCFSISNFLY